MATLTRDQMKQYCFRQLGAPAIEINVDDDQVEDRIDEALEHYRNYHFDGIEQMYMKHQMRASEATLASGDSADFDLSGTITGATSGATAEVTSDIEHMVLHLHFFS